MAEMAQMGVLPEVIQDAAVKEGKVLGKEKLSRKSGGEKRRTAATVSDIYPL